MHREVQDLQTTYERIHVGFARRRRIVLSSDERIDLPESSRVELHDGRVLRVVLLLCFHLRAVFLQSALQLRHRFPLLPGDGQADPHARPRHRYHLLEPRENLQELLLGRLPQIGNEAGFRVLQRALDQGVGERATRVAVDALLHDNCSHVPEPRVQLERSLPLTHLQKRNHHAKQPASQYTALLCSSSAFTSRRSAFAHLQLPLG
mmetsp:Transcript_6429/g.16340  ORF Transcript_6429/g.16340 Transcript_6429/m.16340 type:complete len:206 (+) Transcript_6429:996-1613(+)